MMGSNALEFSALSSNYDRVFMPLQIESDKRVQEQRIKNSPRKVNTNPHQQCQAVTRMKRNVTRINVMR